MFVAAKQLECPKINPVQKVNARVIVIAPLKKRKKLVMFLRGAATGVALAIIAGSKHLTYPEVTNVQTINANQMMIVATKKCSVKLMVPRIFIGLAYL